MKATNLLLLASLSSALCACSTETDGSYSPQPLSVAAVSLANTNNATANNATRANTRANIGTVVDNGTYQLGLVSFPLLMGEPAPKRYNVPYTYGGTGKPWTSTTPIIFAAHYSQFLHAYYPYHEPTGRYAGLASGFTFDLAAQPYTVAEDICVGFNSSSSNNGTTAPTVEFTNMDHVYSRLRLVLTRGAASLTTGRYDITNIRLSNGASGFVASGTYNLGISTPEFTPHAPLAGGWSHLPTAPITLAPGATAPMVDLLIPPQKVDQGLTITFTIDGQQRQVTIAATEFVGSNSSGTTGLLAAGTQNTIALTLRDVSIQLNTSGGVEVEDWAAGSAWGGTHDVPTDRPAPAYLPYVVVEKAGLKVAKGNLFRYPDVFDANMPFALAPDQGYYSGTTFGGDYFNWGNYTPYDYAYGSTDKMVELNKQCAALLGAGFRVPTTTDFQKLLDAGSVWGSYKGQKTVNGFYLGTTTVPSTIRQDDYVFLPAGGWRNDEDHGINSNGSRGCYWTSEANPFPPDNKVNHAWQLYFDVNGVRGTYPASSTMLDGSFIRCVAPLN